MLKDVIFDSDDFAIQPERNCLNELEFLKEKFPKLKVTLFSIPYYGEIDQGDFFRKVSKLDWIELAIHGWDHHSNFECSEWDYQTARDKIIKALQMECFVKGFKAPGWQISRDTYRACEDLGLWVADHKESVYTEPGVPNKDRRPDHLQVYEIDHPWMVHTHTWNCVSNGIPEMIEKWEKDGYPFNNKSNFWFVSEVV